MNKQYTKWAVLTLALSFVIPAITAGINYFMDPLWCFTLSHRYNMKQDDFNERQQKTNWVTYHDFDYDGLIIGSSTSTSLNQHRFKGLTVYNYAINGLQPPEYAPYVRYARERNGRPFKTIFAGFDFMFTATMPPTALEAEKIFEDTNSPLYRIKTLVSLGTLKHSRRNFMNYLYGRHIYYDRDNVKYSTKLSRELTEFNMTRLMQHFEKSDAAYSFNNYRYNPNYRAMLAALRQENPDSKFIVYTTPVITPFMTLMVKCRVLDSYERWIRDIVDVFGECYNFMIPTRVSDDYMNNFHDPNHYYPFIADMMIDAMHNHADPGSSGLCVRITRATVDEKLALIRKQYLKAAARR